MNNWFTNRKTGFVSVFHHNKSSFKKFCVAGRRGLVANVAYITSDLLNHFHHRIQSSLNRMITAIVDFYLVYLMLSKHIKVS